MKPVSWGGRHRRGLHHGGDPPVRSLRDNFISAHNRSGDFVAAPGHYGLIEVLTHWPGNSHADGWQMRPPFSFWFCPKRERAAPGVREKGACARSGAAASARDGVGVSVPAPILPGLRARYHLLRGRYCRPVADGAEVVGVVIALNCFSFRCRWPVGDESFSNGPMKASAPTTARGARSDCAAVGGSAALRWTAVRGFAALRMSRPPCGEMRRAPCGQAERAEGGTSGTLVTELLGAPAARDSKRETG